MTGACGEGVWAHIASAELFKRTKGAQRASGALCGQSCLLADLDFVLLLLLLLLIAEGQDARGHCRRRDGAEADAEVHRRGRAKVRCLVGLH